MEPSVPGLAILPSGLVLPPLPYLLGLAVASLSVGYALYARRPPVTQSVVVALAPWMVAGAAVHALHQLPAVPPALDPLAAAPAVYVTTFVVVGALWAGLAGFEADDVARWLAATGMFAALVPAALAIVTGASRGTLAPLVPTAGLVVSVVVAIGAYAALRAVRPEAVAATGSVGALVVFGHALDGVSTAVGVDLLGSTERTPIPRTIMDVAASLPTAQYIGQGWLFVLVKLVVALGVVVLFADYVREEPVEGNLVLALVAAVGLGPGAHNVLLFAAAGAV